MRFPNVIKDYQQYSFKEKQFKIINKNACGVYLELLSLTSHNPHIKAGK